MENFNDDNFDEFVLPLEIKMHCFQLTTTTTATSQQLPWISQLFILHRASFFKA